MHILAPQLAAETYIGFLMLHLCNSFLSFRLTLEVFVRYAQAFDFCRSDLLLLARQSCSCFDMLAYLIPGSRE